MASLEDITERLLLRSTEAIEQLDDWIAQQDRSKYGLGDVDELDAKYNEFMDQLNSLFIRSQYIKDKIKHERNQKRNSVVAKKNCLDNLLLEFKDITLSLNEIAEKQKDIFGDDLQEYKSPQSTSTKSSMDSFEPKPLKIIKRTSVVPEIATIQSPPKKKIISFHPIQDNMSVTDYTSMPSSPMKRTRATFSSPKKSLHPAKSFDTGLGHSRPKSKDVSDFDRFFKDRQRLSLTFGNNSINDGEDNESDCYSDEETVIFSSNVPIAENEEKDGAQQLRRCNSHESVLSVNHRYMPTNNISKKRFYPLETISQNSSSRNFTSPSIQSVQVRGTSTFSRFTKPDLYPTTGSKPSTSSKELLSSVMATTNTSTDRSNKLTFFDKFSNMFGFSATNPDSKRSANSNLPKRIPSQNFVSVEDINEALNTNILA
ncbi:vacuole-related protein 17 [Nakaseomyces bracarensis]|uniref:Vacuole-related protein 17 n=1 Tax=Nakaseomyces bracarensis TaxID=273131 RepID=A0ABR4NYI2_9SACH